MEKTHTNEKRRSKVHDLVQIGLLSAVFCVLAPIAMPVPLSPVPITFGTFVLYLTAVVLGKKKGTISVMVYLLIGLAGLPVFSGFSAGFTKLMGPGGGYMIGYLPAVFFMGWMEEAWSKRQKEKRTERKHLGFGRQSLVLAGIFLAGAIVCYTFGTAWFIFMMSGTYTLAQALLVCVLPFVPFELIKIVLACVIALPVRQKLRRAGILKMEEFL